jgi:Activator of Hsp90 ATPase homolog 1-like protein
VTVHEQMGVLAGDGERPVGALRAPLRGPAEDVWSALVEPERLRGWRADARVDPREGGRPDRLAGALRDAAAGLRTPGGRSYRLKK